MVIGGKDSQCVEYVHFAGDQPDGDCQDFAEAPVETGEAVALKDYLGRPMICGGRGSPGGCYVYEITNNTWVQGPYLKRRRIGASATCLDSGVCWIFGGTSGVK